MLSFKKELFVGIFYISVAKYSSVVLQLVINAVLSRILLPDDFGLVASVAVFITFFSLLADMGIGPAIVQNRDLSEEDIKAVFSFTIYIAVTISILFYFLANPISVFYSGDSKIVNIVHLLAISVFFYSINIVPQALLQKAKRFKFIGLRTLLVQTVSGALSVFLAFKGFGVYALVFSFVFSSILLFVFNFMKCRIGFSFSLRYTSLQKIQSFSIFQFLFSFINYFSRNLDKILVGRFLDFQALGYYEKSYRLMLFPLQNVPSVINPVLLPLFSELQEDRMLIVQKYCRIIRILSYISLPLGIFLYFSSYELIVLVFGNQWEPSVAIFKILSLSVPFQLIISPAGTIYQAMGATKQLFYSGVVGAFIMLTSFTLPIILWGNLEAVSYGYVLGQFLNFLQTYILFCAVLRTSFLNFLSILIKPVIVSVLLCCILFVYTSLFDLDLFYSLFVKFLITLLFIYMCMQFMGVFNINAFVIVAFKKVRSRLRI